MQISVIHGSYYCSRTTDLVSLTQWKDMHSVKSGEIVTKHRSPSEAALAIAIACGKVNGLLCCNIKSVVYSIIVDRVETYVRSGSEIERRFSVAWHVESLTDIKER